MDVMRTRGDLYRSLPGVILVGTALLRITASPLVDLGIKILILLLVIEHFAVSRVATTGDFGAIAQENDATSHACAKAASTLFHVHVIVFRAIIIAIVNTGSSEFSYTRGTNVRMLF